MNALPPGSGARQRPPTLGARVAVEPPALTAAFGTSRSGWP